MKISDFEISLFRAFVKALGIYQLITVASYLYNVFLEKADIKHVQIGVVTHQNENAAWGFFHFIIAMILIYMTDSICHAVFKRELIEKKTRNENQETE